MSIEAQTWRWTYEPNGITTQFAFDNLVLSADELIVKWWSVASAELAMPAYSVTGLGDALGGNVVFDSAPAATAGSLLEIIRKTTPLQETEFENFIQEAAAERQERSDRQFALAQELRGLLDRALIFSPLDPAGPFRIPAPSVRANKALMFGAGPLAQLTVGSPLAVGSLVVSAFVETLLDDNDADTFLGTLGFSAFVKSLKSMVDGPAFRTAIGATDGGSLVSFPQGRLTLASGVRVMGDTAYTAKTVLYYTAGVVPVWNGTIFIPTLAQELSNDLTQSATGKAGPAAAGPYQVIDAFVWNDAGTKRLTRGPKWIKSSTVTMTSATPCVVTWNNHGLPDGATVRFSTTGALYTGLAVATDYFVTKVDANNFKLSSTLANQVAKTYIATSGAQAGVHTGENYTTDRGTGATTAELESLNGIWVNKYDIANGPLARRGTFVGTVYCNGAAQMDHKPGTLAAGFGEAILGVWNAYNRVEARGLVGNTADSWNYTSAAWRPAAESATARVSAVAGLREDYLDTDYSVRASDSGGNGHVSCGIGWDSITAFTGRTVETLISGAGGGFVAGRAAVQPFGFRAVLALEYVISNTGTISWYGDQGAPTAQQGGQTYVWRY